jgi:hypothetical protein
MFRNYTDRSQIEEKAINVVMSKEEILEQTRELLFDISRVNYLNYRILISVYGLSLFFYSELDILNIHF